MGPGRLEQHLEVVRQLCAAGVAWVHCDENGVRGVHQDVAALKLDAVIAGDGCLLDVVHLLRHH